MPLAIILKLFININEMEAAALRSKNFKMSFLVFIQGMRNELLEEYQRQLIGVRPGDKKPMSPAQRKKISDTMKKKHKARMKAKKKADKLL